MTSLFLDPDPSSLSFQHTPLRDYLHKNGFSWILDLRTFLRSLDYSCFYQKYSPDGRHPYHPAALLGLVFYGILKGNSSLRSLEKMARVDLCCMWLTGGIHPDHSVIGKFLKKHQEELSHAFFEQLTANIIKTLNVDGTKISGDGTVIQAVASRYHNLTQEALIEKTIEIENKIPHEINKKKQKALKKT